MQALVLSDRVHLERDYPIPTPGKDEVLIQVLQAGICQTDLELSKGYMNFHGVLGHEFVGRVESGAWAGKRVVGEMNIACGKCDYCLHDIPSQCRNRRTMGLDRYDGAFSEKLILPMRNLYLVPESVSDEQAVFVEPLAAALQLTAQTHISPYHRVALIGAGKLGMLVAQVIALTGSDFTLIARHERQFALAERWGIPAALYEDLTPRSFDLVIDCTGVADGFAAALELVRPRGTLHLKSTYAGLPQADLTRLVVDEIKVETSRCGPFPAALRLLERGLIDTASLIDARYPLEEAESAFDHAARKGVLKVLLQVEG